MDISTRNTLAMILLGGLQAWEFLKLIKVVLIKRKVVMCFRYI